VKKAASVAANATPDAPLRRVVHVDIDELALTGSPIVAVDAVEFTKKQRDTLKARGLDEKQIDALASIAQKELARRQFRLLKPVPAQERQVLEAIAALSAGLADVCGRAPMGTRAKLMSVQDLDGLQSSLFVLAAKSQSEANQLPKKHRQSEVATVEAIAGLLPDVRVVLRSEKSPFYLICLEVFEAMGLKSKPVGAIGAFLRARRKARYEQMRDELELLAADTSNLAQAKSKAKDDSK
jgi:hypothetical protein